MDSLAFPSSPRRGRSIKACARRALASLGLFPHAKRGVEWLRSLTYMHKTRFTLQIEGVPVSFVTRDAHSKVWCYRRNENRQGDLHEPAIIKAFARCIGDAAVFADVGGHIGYYSCVAGALNSRAKVFCFEMNRGLVPIIKANVHENDLYNVTIVPYPVADRRKVVSYDATSIHGGHALSTKRADGCVCAETVTLDGFFAVKGTAPDIIKIDVEGAEMDVLRGAETILERCRPLLFLEIHPRNLADFGASVGEIVGHLNGLGYSFFKPAYLRADGPIEPVTAGDLIHLDRTDIVICVPDRRWAGLVMGVAR